MTEQLTLVERELELLDDLLLSLENIPLQQIEALLSYVESDIENGVQMNDEWDSAVDDVRYWLSLINRDRDSFDIEVDPVCK